MVKYGHGLASWTVYHNVGCGQNVLQIKKGLFDIFKFNFFFPKNQLYRSKSALARFYRPAYNRILDNMLNGDILHIDETQVALRGKKGYVWVLANLEGVYFFYRDSREGAFLHDMLKEFSGVLISDFFSAYDSLECPQQKCLVHLLRDLNDDLLRHPFDLEFRAVALRFATLLRKIVGTIDKFGLKRWHLGKHKVDVDDFVNDVVAREFVSEAAQKFQARLSKSEGKLFTFLDYDGVPWNNTNAEHAIKCFAKYRRFADGRFTEASIKEYLVLLSVYQTCEYRGVKFLDFLLSKSRDVGAFAGGGR
jgi:hypothetical protein